MKQRPQFVHKPKPFTPGYLASIDPLPVRSASGAVKFVGTFTGLSVEVNDPEAIKQLALAGCFGQGTRSRSFPASIHTSHVETVLERQLERRHEWQQKYNFHSRNESGKELRVIGEEVEEMLSNGTLHFRELEEDHAKHEIDPFSVTENLSLLLEETIFLAEKLNCLEVKSLDGEVLTTDRLLVTFCSLKKNFLSSYVSYLYLRSKNWIVKSGLKFGGDFLLYKKGPQYFHASFIVLIQPYQNGQKMSEEEHYLDNYDFQCFNRIAETTAKELLILEVHYPTDVDAADPKACLGQLQHFKVSETFPKHFNLSVLRSNQ
ncbi:tRNA-splicing endonuclease subunit Sen2 [Wyeomyia smithii]|uniref:tRNA-splicing endonuclease subunit Sen2 n=1 Tax=Wyeomyia smithii TaxID=174621 RepID=UPI002467CFC1|nr:tRNA-splicing endonuclease subunit Sen2 [Wyeomyia smithii]